MTDKKHHHDENENLSAKGLLSRVRNQVESGAVAMKPRWQIMLHALALLLAVSAVLALGLLLVRALFFFIHASELSTLMGFGPRGFAAFAHRFPWSLLLLALGLSIGAVWGVRHFRAGARLPGVVLFAIILGLLGVIGYAEERLENHGRFPSRAPMRIDAPFGLDRDDIRRPFQPGSGVCRCEVKTVREGEFDAVDVDSDRAYVVVVNNDSPYATTSGLRPGDTVFVAGEQDGARIRAFGIHKRSFDLDRVHPDDN